MVTLIILLSVKTVNLTKLYNRSTSTTIVFQYMHPSLLIRAPSASEILLCSFPIVLDSQWLFAFYRISPTEPIVHRCFWLASPRTSFATFLSVFGNLSPLLYNLTTLFKTLTTPHHVDLVFNKLKTLFRLLDLSGIKVVVSPFLCCLVFLFLSCLFCPLSCN